MGKGGLDGNVLRIKPPMCITIQATAQTLEVLEAAREMGVLMGKGGLDGNVLRIKPPMCITIQDADFAVDVLDRALSRVTAG
jgi:4-aminobutyrate aminotransferase-like enzyme